jgi:hypothetical protein
MFTKTAFILAIVIGTASGALAVTKHQSTLPAAASTCPSITGRAMSIYQARALWNPAPCQRATAGKRHNGPGGPRHAFAFCEAAVKCLQAW